MDYRERWELKDYLFGRTLERRILLFHIGVTRPERFDFAHAIAWETAGVLLVIGLFVAFLAGGRKAAAGSSESARELQPSWRRTEPEAKGTS